MNNPAIRCQECHGGVDEFMAIAERHWSNGCGELPALCPECAGREPASEVSGRRFEIRGERR